MLEVWHNCLPAPHKQWKRDVSFLSQMFKPISIPSRDNRLKLGLVEVPLNIFLCITHFLDVLHILILYCASSALGTA